MGLFSSKKVVNTGTAVSPLLGERPNLIRNAIIRATINDLPYTPSIVDAILSGYNVDPDAFYRQGESGKYRLGLPYGFIPTIRERNLEARQVIADVEGVLVENIQFNTNPILWGALSADEYGRLMTQQLFFNHIEPATGITLIEGTDTNQIGIGKVAEYTSAVIEYETYDDDAYEGNYIEPEPIITITMTVYDPADKVGTAFEKEFFYSFTGDFGLVGINELNTKLYYAAYQLPDGLGGFLAEKYWVYDWVTELYPTLYIYDEEDLLSPYFPVVPVRIDKQMVGDVNHAIPLYADQEFKSEVNDILSTVGADLENLQEALADNPDLGDIDDSFIIFAVPFGTEHDGDINNTSKTQAELEYCWRYFNYLMDDIQKYDKVKFQESEATAIAAGKAPLFNVLQIKSSELLQSIYWNYIDVIDLPWVAKETGGRPDGNYQMGGLLVEEISPREDRFYSKSRLYFFYYNDELETCKRITIEGIYIENNVIAGNSVVNTLYDSFSLDIDAPKDGFYLPLAYKTLVLLNPRDQDIVSFESLVLVTYAIKVTKIKWYQKASFFKLLRIVLFVVAVATANPALFALDLAVSEIAYIIIESIVVNYLIGEGLSIVFSLLVDIIGVDAAFLLAIAAIAYGGSVELGFLDPSALLPDAMVLIQAASMLSGAASKVIAKDSLNLSEEFKELKKDTAAQEAAIKELGLSSDFGIDINDLVESILFRPERPDQFFARTINPAIGLSSLDTVNYYYDNALSLDLENI